LIVVVLISIIGYPAAGLALLIAQGTKRRPVVETKTEETGEEKTIFSLKKDEEEAAEEERQSLKDLDSSDDNVPETTL
jgi:hypothetical protein